MCLWPLASNLFMAGAMYPNLLPFLQCPTCSHAPLLLVVGREDGDEVVEGGLKCERCMHVMSIREGIVDAIGAGPVPVTAAQLVNYTAAAAWAYERLWRRTSLSLLSGRRFPLTEELHKICTLLGPVPNQLVLDVACSTALYARAVAQVAPQAIIAGVDHSWAMLREARRFARRERRAISLVRAAAQALPFRAGSAAGYGMGGSLNEIGDATRMLAEARRVLGGRGRMVSMNLLTARTRRGRLLQRLIGAGGVYFPGQEALNRGFQQSGFAIADQQRWRVVQISLLLPSS